jgi:photosystem II stability/assembly factor-like uncharacterized protein
VQKGYDWIGLHDVQFLNRKSGWAVGEMGGIFHTNDGGKNWTQQRGYIFESLRALCFVSAKEGWAVGNLSKFLNLF